MFEKTDTRLPGNGKPYLYTRLGNPTRSALETQLSSIHMTNHAVIANNIQAAYYALSLLFNNKTDEVLVITQRSSFRDGIIKSVFGCVPQLFKVITCMKFEDATQHLESNARIKLVIIDNLLIGEEGVQVVDQVELSTLYGFAKSRQANIALDISATYGTLTDLKAKPEFFDFMVSDLKYYSGIEGNAGAVILT